MQTKLQIKQDLVAAKNSLKEVKNLKKQLNDQLKKINAEEKQIRLDQNSASTRKSALSAYRENNNKQSIKQQIIEIKNQQIQKRSHKKSLNEKLKQIITSERQERQQKNNLRNQAREQRRAVTIRNREIKAEKRARKLNPRQQQQQQQQQIITVHNEESKDNEITQQIKPRKKFVTNKNKVISQTMCDLLIEEMPYDSQFINLMTQEMKTAFQQILNDFGSVKIKLFFEYTTTFDKSDFSDRQCSLDYVPLENNDQIQPVSNKMLNDFEFDTLKMKKSGCKQIIIYTFRLYFVKFNFNAGEYIQLPEQITNKQAVLNIQNKNDNYCLIYSYMLFRYLQHNTDKNHLERAAKYAFIFSDDKRKLTMKSVGQWQMNQEIDVTGITFPCGEDMIKKFCQRVKVNVQALSFRTLEDGQIQYFPFINTTREDFKDQLQILVVNDEENDKSHIIPILKINALLNKNKTNTLSHCLNCLTGFNNKDALEKHSKYCLDIKDTPSLDVFPEEGSILEFKNLQQTVKIPYFFTADFESILEKVQLTNEEFIEKVKRMIKRFKQNNLIGKDALEKEIIKGINLSQKSRQQIEQIYQKLITYDDSQIKLEKHKVVSYGLQLCSETHKQDQYFEYAADNEYDVINNFISTILKQVEKIQKFIKETNIAFENTPQIQQMKREATHCYICKKEFNMNQINYESDDDEEKNNKNKKLINTERKVVDHCHLTGIVRGIAHSKCNLQFNLKNCKIPVVMHNLRGYDSHFIIRIIGEVIYNKCQEIDEKLKTETTKTGRKKLQDTKKNIKQLECTIQNNEKVQSFVHGKTKFIDSFQFMASSLDALGKKLHYDQKYFTTNFVSNKYPQLNQQQIQNVINKGFFPYSYLDNYSKLDQTDFPSYESFFNILTQKNIDKKDYEFAKQLYQDLEMKSFKEYLLLYQAIDVKLLADVWNNFRDKSYEQYGLDLGYFVSLPSFSFAAMLKFTGVKLELISDPQIYQLFERQIKGGVSGTGEQNYAKANNQFCPEYDPKQKSNYILYLDSTNLYGQAMTYKLPTGQFKIKNDLTLEDIMKYQDSDETGYIVEVDLEVPQQIHKTTTGYPLAFERTNTSNFKLSDYQKKIIGDNKIVQCEKLIGTLSDKINYVVNIKALKLYLQLGLKLKKIHTAVQYHQDNFLEKYIMFNKDQRDIAKKNKDEILKDLFKLMNNAIYGKTLENVRKHSASKFVYDKQEMQKIVNGKFFKNFIEIGENCILVNMHKKTVNLNKPLFIGGQVLDNSKCTMYDYLYNYIKKQYEDVKVLFYDTDSLILNITTEQNVYKNMAYNFENHNYEGIEEQSPMFQYLKNYCQENQIDMKQHILNSQTLGKMKDENINTIITEFIGVRSKCYSFLTADNQNVKKLKGIAKNIVKEKITHQQYIDCVFKNISTTEQQFQFKSQQHQVWTISQKKQALAALNDKVYQLDNNTNYSFGDYRIPQ